MIGSPMAVKEVPLRFINDKICVQRRKSRGTVVVSTSARQAGGPWFDSRIYNNVSLKH